MASHTAFSATGTGPLARILVAPFVRENVGVRGSVVQCLNSGVVKVSTGARLRNTHLLVPDSTSSRTYRAGSLDVNGLWSEWSPLATVSIANFSAGATDGSIGSGSNAGVNIEEPSVYFPDLSVGSGIVDTFRTVVSDGFYEELRRSEWEEGISVFNIVLIDLDEDQVSLLETFYMALNGSFKPFYFIWTDPLSAVDDENREQRFIVRFRDTPSSELSRVDRSDVRMTLVEIPTITGGGNV